MTYVRSALTNSPVHDTEALTHSTNDLVALTISKGLVFTGNMKRVLVSPAAQAYNCARSFHATAAPAVSASSNKNKQQRPESHAPNTADNISRNAEASGIETTRTLQSKKTIAERDEELREKLEKLSGGGAGVEYENGKPVGLKRGVKDNMFRVI